MVRLEPLSEAHIRPAYVEWLNDPVVCRDNRHGSGYTIDSVREYVRAVMNADDTMAYAIVRRSDGRHVGNVSLNAISAALRSAEISILIGERSAWGCGVGTEACRLIIAEAFDRLGLHRVYMGMLTRNTGMMRIAQKLGMNMAGIARDAFRKDGVYHDVAQWSLLNPSQTEEHDPQIVLLMRYGNLVGLEYLAAFRQTNLVPRAIVFEGDGYSLRDRQIVEERTQGRYKPLFLGDVLPETAPRMLHYVRDHNSAECLQLLKRLRPDVLVLGGVGILKSEILRTALWGALNCHPGQLPRYRGCSAVEWAIFNDDPVAASCHIVTDRIDAGPVIHWSPMPVYRGDDYADVRTRMIGHQRDVMIQGLRNFISCPQGWPYDPSDKGVYHKTIDSASLEIVKNKVRTGLYPHMCER